MTTPTRDALVEALKDVIYSWPCFSGWSWSTTSRMSLVLALTRRLRATAETSEGPDDAKAETYRRGWEAGHKAATDAHTSPDAERDHPHPRRAGTTMMHDRWNMTDCEPYEPWWRCAGCNGLCPPYRVTCHHCDEARPALPTDARTPPDAHWNMTDLERYDHATAVHRGGRIRELKATIYAIARANPGIRFSQAAFDAANCPNGPTVRIGFDSTTREGVLPGEPFPTQANPVMSRSVQRRLAVQQRDERQQQAERARLVERLEQLAQDCERTGTPLGASESVDTLRDAIAALSATSEGKE